MAGIRVLGIDNIMLGVGDLEQARLFYEGVLGLPIKFAFPQAGIVGYHLGSEEPGLLLRAGALEAAPARETPRVWLEVPDAREAAATLRDAGATIVGDVREIATGWVVEVADAWGNALGLTNYANQPARRRSRAAP